MRTPPDTSIYRYSWNHNKRDEVPGVMLRSDTARIFIPRDQLATFADYAIDALETYEQEQQ